MKIIQTVSGIGLNSAGPSYSVPGLCRGLQAVGVDVCLHTRMRSDAPALPFNYVAYPYLRSRFLPGGNPAMRHGLKRACRDADILHSNGLWNMPSVYPVWAVRGTKCKLVVAPRGTLATWALQKGYWKKKIFGWLFQNQVLRRADMFHATSEKEYEEIRARGYRQPVAIVPIGMDVPEFLVSGFLVSGFWGDVSGSEFLVSGSGGGVSGSEFLVSGSGVGVSASEFKLKAQEKIDDMGNMDANLTEVTFEASSKRNKKEPRLMPLAEAIETVVHHQIAAGSNPSTHNIVSQFCMANKSLRKKVVFFGRLHKVKAIDNLILAWEKICAQSTTNSSVSSVYSVVRDWQLLIAGPDRGVKGELENLIAERHIPGVSFVGELNGQAKYDFLASADIYVLPSMTENFGVTVAEALACGTPVIASQGTPWQGLERERCGRWVPIGVEPLVAALKEMMAMSDEDRAAMGARGREWIRRDFSWKGIGAKMKAAYEWLLGQGDKPEWVRVE